MRLELSTQQLIAEIEDGVGWMTFNRPERHNALSGEMQQAIPEVLGRFAHSAEVRVAVMKGAGDKAFVSGADITELGSGRAATPAAGDGPRVGFAEFDKPLIAMIRGYCIGGGLATALAADLRIASDDARFGIPAARLGVGYPMPAVRTLVDAVGPAYANEILFTARRLSADEALRMGLLNRVVARDDLEPTVRELAASIVDNAPLSVRAAKVTIAQSLRDPSERDVALCHRVVTECFESQDFVEGRAAFLEKRAPRFQGR